MKSMSGQALLELALCAPVVVVLALGATAVVQVEDANAGLDAATRAALSAAARAPDQASADAAAQARFTAVVAAYPLRGTSLHLRFGSFSRGADVSATADGYVDVGWAALVLPRHVELNAHGVIQLEPWRTHRTVA
jgi:Flp pilus assembly protein TadG